MINNTKQLILLIEDDEIDREVVHRAIGSLFSVIDAENGTEGREKARTDSPDCILLDYRLPDIDGIQLLSEFDTESIPVVMMTGVGNESIAVEAMKAGAQDYICKGELTSELLQQVIRRAIQTAHLQRCLKSQRAELESFVAVASHDLRAPLRHIVRFAELARDQCHGKVDDEVDEFLERIVAGGSRMTNLLNALVDFARNGRSETELDVVALNDAVEHARCNLCEVIDETKAIVNVERLPDVLGHDVSLIELFQNLIGNAIKYAGDSTPIVDIDASRDGGQWIIAVRDNGIGISSEYYERIFVPFRRLHSHNEIEGSGIGLATCKRIVEQHRGRIWVESESQVGSTFFFTLQAAEPVEANSDGNVSVACAAVATT